MGTSKIEWTEYSWNPVIGCTKCSPGCLNCYAERMACRLARIEESKKPFKPKYSRVTINNEWAGNVYCDESALDKPFHWRKPRRIFVCSMSDLFHEKVPFEFIDNVFNTIELCQQHIFQILTKRPKVLLKWSRANCAKRYLRVCKNVHLGVSISTQAEDWKIAELLKISAAVRFVSVEPLLEEAMIIPLKGVRFNKGVPEEYEIHQVIIGAESLGSRPGRECKLDDVRGLVGQCKAAGVPVFVKQLHLNGKLVKDITKFPKDLQFRQYPKGAAK